MTVQEVNAETPSKSRSAHADAGCGRDCWVPELERGTREEVDFGLAQQPDGAIFLRGEFNNFAAVECQAGTILRALREHQMSADGEFLKRTRPKIKLAAKWLTAKDANDDGLSENDQHNTLDADWLGAVAWLSGLYLAALAAAAVMASQSRFRKGQPSLITGNQVIPFGAHVFVDLAA